MNKLKYLILAGITLGGSILSAGCGADSGSDMSAKDQEALKNGTMHNVKMPSPDQMKSAMHPKGWKPGWVDSPASANPPGPGG